MGGGGGFKLCNAIFEEYNTLFSVKTLKTLCYQDGCSFPNTLNWEELSVKILNCAILVNSFALFF